MIGILFVLAIPSFSSWIANTQIRNSAEAMSNGLQIARGEAIHRNALVRFCLPTATSWIVTINEVTCSAAPPAANIVQKWSAEEGAKTAQITTADSANTVTFNGLGRIAPNDDGSSSLRQMDFTSSVSNASEIRVMRVVIGVGGGVRMCDPHLASGDPRGC
jgi:type IV fimbrial biogenesis protein FimT